MLLEHIGARRTIAQITFLWRLCCVVMMFVTTRTGFSVLRFLLSVFEAGFYRGVILFLTCWYPTERRADVRPVPVCLGAGRRHRRPARRRDHDRHG